MVRVHPLCGHLRYRAASGIDLVRARDLGINPNPISKERKRDVLEAVLGSMVSIFKLLTFSI